MRGFLLLLAVVVGIAVSQECDLTCTTSSTGNSLGESAPLGNAQGGINTPAIFNYMGNSICSGISGNGFGTDGGLQRCADWCSANCDCLAYAHDVNTDLCVLWGHNSIWDEVASEDALPVETWYPDNLWVYTFDGRTVFPPSVESTPDPSSSAAASPTSAPSESAAPSSSSAPSESAAPSPSSAPSQSSAVSPTSAASKTSSPSLSQQKAASQTSVASRTRTQSPSPSAVATVMTFSSASTGGTPDVYRNEAITVTVQLDEPSDDDIFILYGFEGTATPIRDYTISLPLTGVFKINAGQAGATWKINNKMTGSGTKTLKVKVIFILNGFPQLPTTTLTNGLGTTFVLRGNKRPGTRDVENALP